MTEDEFIENWYLTHKRTFNIKTQIAIEDLWDHLEVKPQIEVIDEVEGLITADGSDSEPEVPQKNLDYTKYMSKEQLNATTQEELYAEAKIQPKVDVVTEGYGVPPNPIAAKKKRGRPKKIKNDSTSKLPT